MDVLAVGAAAQGGGGKRMKLGRTQRRWRPEAARCSHEGGGIMKGRRRSNPEGPGEA